MQHYSHSQVCPFQIIILVYYLLYNVFNFGPHYYLY